LIGEPHQEVHTIEKITTYTGEDARRIIAEVNHNPSALIEPTISLNEPGLHTSGLHTTGLHTTGLNAPGTY